MKIIKLLTASLILALLTLGAASATDINQTSNNLTIDDADVIGVSNQDIEILDEEFTGELTDSKLANSLAEEGCDSICASHNTQAEPTNLSATNTIDDEVYGHILIDYKLDENATGNGTSGTVTNATFFSYFDENGVLKNISYDELNFDGDFTGIGVTNITINKPIIFRTDNALFNNVSFIIASDNVTMDGFRLNQKSARKLFDIVSVRNITLSNNEINFTAVEGEDSYAVFANACNNLNFYNNTLNYVGNTVGTSINNGVLVNKSGNVTFKGNNFYIVMPSTDMNYDQLTLTVMPYSGGLIFIGCDGVLFTDNTVLDNFEKYYGLYDTLNCLVFGDCYCVINGSISEVDSFIFPNQCRNVTVSDNTIYANGHEYTYGISISANNAVIRDNMLNVSSNCCACAIKIDGISSDINIKSNTMNITAEDIIRGIDSVAVWGPIENTNYINNTINARSYAACGIESVESNPTISQNHINVYGNYTVGIAAISYSNGTISDNEIGSFGSNVGNESTGDPYIPMESTGIYILRANCKITGNTISSTGKSMNINENNTIIVANNADSCIYICADSNVIENNTINTQDTYAIDLTDSKGNTVRFNELYANVLYGDDAVKSSDESNVIENNLPSEVNMTKTFTDLQDLIDAADEGAVIELDEDYINNGSVSADGISISKTLTINGKGHTLDANGKSRIFNINANDVILKNIVLKNGLYLEGKGGAVYFNNNGNVTNCNFTNNTAKYGGAIYAEGENTYIVNSQFEDKTANFTGVAYGGIISNCTLNGYSFGNVDSAIINAQTTWFGNNATVTVTVPYGTGNITIKIGNKIFSMVLEDNAATVTVNTSELDIGPNEILTTYNYIASSVSSLEVIDGKITNETFKYYFDKDNDNYLFDYIPQNAVLDFQGSFIGNNYTVFIDKPVNVTSSTANAVFDSGPNPNKTWVRFNLVYGADHTNITGISIVNGELLMRNVSFVTVDNIHINAYMVGVGSNHGFFAICNESYYITIKNSFFENGGTGSSCLLIGKGTKYVVVDNNRCNITGSSGNILSCNPYYGSGDNPEFVNYTNNVIYSNRNASPMTYGITLSGQKNLVENNTFHSFKGNAIVIAYSLTSSNNIYRNNTLSDSTSMQIAKDSIAENNNLKDTAVTIGEGSKLSNNIVMSLTINGANVIVENNTITDGMTVQSNGNIIFNNRVFSTQDYAVDLKSYKNNTVTSNYLYASSLVGNDAVKSGDESNVIADNLPIGVNMTVKIDGTYSTLTVTLTPNVTGNITVVIDGVETIYSISGSKAINLSMLGAGEHQCQITFIGDGEYAPATVNITFAIPSKGKTFTDLKNSIDALDDEDVLELSDDYVNDLTSGNGITITKAITINGNGHILDAKDQSRVFNIEASNVCLKNIVFRNGVSTDGGAIMWTGNNGTLFNCSFENCSATNSGGAVYAEEDSNVRITSSIFKNNKAKRGGAISGGIVFECKFESNTNPEVSSSEDYSEVVPEESDADNNGNLILEFPSDAEGTIEVFINGTSVAVVKITKGIAQIDLSKYGGNIEVTFVYSGDDNYPGFRKNATVYVNPTIISASNVKVLYTACPQYKIKVYESKGIVAAKETVVVKSNGKSYKTLTTNSNGIASFKIEMIPGTYKLTITSLGKTVTKTLTVKHVVTLKTVKVKKSAKKLVLTATLSKVNKKYLKNKKITFKFNGKKYTAKTNKKGIAKVTVKSSVLKKLKVGKKVTYQATYLKDTAKKTVKINK